MVCTKAANGPCDLPANGWGCRDAKIFESFPPISGLFVDGFDDHIIAYWNTALPYPDQYVVMFYREVDVVGRFYPPVLAPRDTGELSTVTGIPYSTLMTLAIRVENATHYGPWQFLDGVTDEGWDSQSQLIYHNGELLTHQGEILLFS